MVWGSRKFGSVGRTGLAASLLLACLWGPGIAEAAYNQGAPTLESRAEPLPRTTARSALFEIVVVKAEGQLLLFLDDYVGNRPVGGAGLALQLDGAAGEPREIASGVYALDWVAPTGVTAVELAVEIVAGDRSDRLVASLPLPQPTLAMPAGATPAGAVSAETMPAGARSAGTTVLGSFAIERQTLLLLLAFLLGAGASHFLLQRRQVVTVAPAAVNTPPGRASTDSDPAPGPRLLRTGS